MTTTETAALPELDLHAGEVVEVRPPEEILATLDADGKLDGLPFMPEMLQFCGRRFRVSARAHKACDTINKTGCRSMNAAVHLENLRCDGAAHGGCQANCLLYWKEAWLKRAKALDAPNSTPAAETMQLIQLQAATRRRDDPGAFACQATEMFTATAPLNPRDPRQYVQDLTYGNVRPGRFVKYMALAIFNAMQRWRGGRTFPVVGGKLSKTPKGTLDLRVGELVRVKSREEIVATLDTRDSNRGLYFDKELFPYCGQTFRVAARVEKIVNERTGQLMHFGSDCIALEGVVCKGNYSDRRLFCPRAIIPYWRELWLERVEQ